MNWTEVQVDRLVGPTHHFGGLGIGNIASLTHAGNVSNPAAAAIQGLEKMRLVANAGAEQWILPPQKRPDFAFLRAMGFSGDDRHVLSSARDEAPELLSAAMSSSAMWTANAATVTSQQGVTTMTVANLSSSLHRAIEWQTTWEDLRSVFPDCIEILASLIGGTAMRDEGAANHMRLCGPQPTHAIDVFVYGDQDPLPQRFFPRQTLASFQAIARRHRLDPRDVCFLKQNRDAIDAGAFHNDVVAMSHLGLLIHHEMAFAENDAAMKSLSRKFEQRMGAPLHRIEVNEQTLSVKDAIATYLFNSQIVSTGDTAQPPILICPIEVQRHAAAKGLVEQWQTENVFSQVEFVDLGQSMAGGGGPACLRLRVPMRKSDVSSMNPSCRWTPRLHEILERLIRDEYPDRVTIDELSSIEFVRQACRARDQIAGVLSGDA